jgi:predicted enzyme related to lactoylglutathione lyase
MESSDNKKGSTLETVIIFTTHMEELAHFYQEALGIGPYERAPRHLGCHVGPIYLGFDQVDEMETTQVGSRITLWFAVDDIEKTYQRLISLGAQVRYPPTKKPWGVILASAHDPDGNIVGLSQRQG